jgi:hypothetical protein
MSITYEWSFPEMDVAPSDGGKTNVVKVIHWRYAATDGAYTAEAYSTAAMPDAGEPFTDYADLTEEIVSGWVIRSLGKQGLADMEANLAMQIQNKKTPPVVPMLPPWLSTVNAGDTKSSQL